MSTAPLQRQQPPLAQSVLPLREPHRIIKVLIVDDSVVLRSLLGKVLREDPLLDVVGTARDGNDALVKAARMQPDVVTLDIEMPGLDGLATLRLLRENHPKIQVIMCSSLTKRGAATTVESLVAGAADYVAKQRGGNDDTPVSVEELGAQLRTKIKALFQPRTAEALPVKPVRPFTAIKPRLGPLPRILAIGVSTGGPSALVEVLPKLPADFPLPIVIVQHMPPFFTQLLAERLDKLSAITVREAREGDQLKAGCALIAPGDFHMKLVGRDQAVTVQLDQGDRENSCRPAVDVLFRSVAAIYGGSVLATILTGMGQDGLLGVRELKRLGASVLAQDAATSVVWGMPGAVAEAGLADAVLPIGNIVPEILRRI
jgi:two-component system chemotaxis response regulator CheB